MSFRVLVVDVRFHFPSVARQSNLRGYRYDQITTHVKCIKNKTSESF